MKVYRLKNTDLGCGYITSEVDNVRTELEVNLEEVPEECEYRQDEINEFIVTLRVLPIGGSAFLCEWFVSVETMAQKDYDNLPEFQGW